MKLRELPLPTLIADTPKGHTAAYSPEQVRAIQLEAARDALEEAAKVCDVVADGGASYCEAGECAAAIRAITLEQP